VTRGVRAYRPPADARATLELAVELVRAESADHNDDPVRARCLAIGEEESSAWAEQLWGSFRDLVAGWPRFEEAWWPRTEEPAKVALGTGTVVLSGRFDIVLGGVPTGLVSADRKGARAPVDHAQQSLHLVPGQSARNIGEAISPSERHCADQVRPSVAPQVQPSVEAREGRRHVVPRGVAQVRSALAAEAKQVVG
jgi:hypothetical protein